MQTEKEVYRLSGHKILLFSSPKTTTTTTTTFQLFPLHHDDHRHHISIAFPPPPPPPPPPPHFYCFPETSTTFHSKRPCEHCENSNVYGTLIMKCPKCFWHDYYKICPICDHQIPEGRNYMKEGFRRCHDCGAVTHKNAKTLETNFYSPSKEENEDED